MNKDFTLYSEALALKELGFDEPCFVYYKASNENKPAYPNHGVTQNSLCMDGITAPTFSQAFRFFREKYGLYDIISKNGYMIEGELNGEFLRITKLSLKSHEEAELACLKHLIELTK